MSSSSSSSSPSDDEDVGSRPKRRRIIVNDDDNDDDDNDTSSHPSPLPRPVDSRAVRLEQRAAERRARAAAAAAAQEPPTLFPGDQGHQDTVDAQPVVQEDYIMDDDEEYKEEDEEEGEDLLDNAERDYQRIDALDTYGTEGLDDREYDDMDIDQRRVVEQELARRDRESGRTRNDGFYGMLDAMEEEEDDEARRARRGVFRVEKNDEEEEDSEDDDLEADDQVNLEAFDVPLREWIAQNRTRYVSFVLYCLWPMRVLTF